MKKKKQELRKMCKAGLYINICPTTISPTIDDILSSPMILNINSAGTLLGFIFACFAFFLTF
jgi:uncharacterized membrane protein